MAMDTYHLVRVSIAGETSAPIQIDECDILSIMRMSKSRNKNLHKKLLKWYKEVNTDVTKKTNKKGEIKGYDLSQILDGIDGLV